MGLENLPGRPVRGLGCPRRWRRRRRPVEGSGRFASTYASARLAARASGERRSVVGGRAGGFGAPGSRPRPRPRPPGRWGSPAPTPYARRFLGPRRDFIEKRYVELKKANPDLPILIRECSEVQPKLWARYGECRPLGAWDPGGNQGSGRETAAHGQKKKHKNL